MQAMKHSVVNVPSKKAVKLEVVGPRFFEEFCFGLYFLEANDNEKMG